MKRALAILLASLALARAAPLPVLHEYHSNAEEVFGLYWVSAGIEYKYTLEANIDGGFGWFTVATWANLPTGVVMSGYTIYGDLQPTAIARVIVEQVGPQPVPKGILDWKFLSPVRF